MVEMRPLDPYEPAPEQAQSRPTPLAETAPTGEGVPRSLAEEFLSRARIARDRYGGHPPERWSTGEQSAVALLLSSRPTLARLDMTPNQACLDLADDLRLSFNEAIAWVEQHGVWVVGVQDPPLSAIGAVQVVVEGGAGHAVQIGDLLDGPLA